MQWLLFCSGVLWWLHRCQSSPDVAEHRRMLWGSCMSIDCSMSLTVAISNMLWSSCWPMTSCSLWMDRTSAGEIRLSYHFVYVANISNIMHISQRSYFISIRSSSSVGTDVRHTLLAQKTYFLRTWWNILCLFWYHCISDHQLTMTVSDSDETFMIVLCTCYGDQVSLTLAW